MFFVSKTSYGKNIQSLFLKPLQQLITAKKVEVTTTINIQNLIKQVGVKKWNI
jgi:hypothetical protein